MISPASLGGFKRTGMPILVEMDSCQQGFGALSLPLASNAVTLTSRRRSQFLDQRVRDRGWLHRGWLRWLPHHREPCKHGDRHAERNAGVGAVMRGDQSLRRITPGVQQPHPVNQPKKLRIAGGRRILCDPASEGHYV